MALTSLLLAGVLLVYWFRSRHAYVDGFTLGKGSPTESHFSAVNGRISMEVIQTVGGTIYRTTYFYDFRNVMGYLLILPGFWLAIKIRSWLPRPPGMKRNDER